MAKLRSKRDADKWCAHELKKERYTLSPQELFGKVIHLLDSEQIVERMYDSGLPERQQRVAVTIFECVINACKDIIRTTHVTSSMDTWTDENQFYVLHDLLAYIEQVDRYLQHCGVGPQHHARKTLRRCIERYKNILEYVPRPASQLDEVCAIISILKQQVREASQELHLCNIPCGTKFKTIIAILDQITQETVTEHKKQSTIVLLEDLRGREERGTHDK